MTTTPKEQFKASYRMTYDVQKLRIAMGNRLVQWFYRSLGIKPGSKIESAKDGKQVELLDELRRRGEKIALFLAESPRGRFDDDLIPTPAAYRMVSQYLTLERAEEQGFKGLENMLKDQPIAEWLLSVKGVGTAMASCLIGEIDIEKAPKVSSLWAYAGLDVVHVQRSPSGVQMVTQMGETNRVESAVLKEGGYGRSRHKWQMRDVEYTDRDGVVTMRKSIGYNPNLKTKMLGVLGASFLKTKSPYADVYYNYKLRLENERKDWTKGHIHNAAVRYMVKMFLIDLYVQWRTVEGLPVRPSYQEEKLGHVHDGDRAAVAGGKLNQC